MTRARGFLANALLLLLLATTASAQPAGRRGRGFGPRGLPGPGDLPSSPAALLRIAEVRQELKTSDEQNKQIDEVLAALGEQTRASFANFQELQNIDETERAKRFAEARQATEAANQKADEKLAGILDQKQLRRLNALRLQREGAAGLLRPEIAKQLALSQKQRDELKAIQEESRGPGPGGANFQQMSEEERREFFAEMQKKRQAADADMLAVLTDDQKKSLAQMKGEAFDFPPPRGGFGPGGFGPRGGAGPSGAPGREERQRPPIKKREE